MHDVSVVIPAHNSENTISEVVEGIIAQFEGIYSYEIILVNDGSKDRTLSVISEIATYDQRIKVIDLTRNFGQASAIMAGLREARGKIIVKMDDDLQHPPRELHKIIEKINEGYDIVFAIPHKKNQSWWRNIGSSLNNLMAGILINKPGNIILSSYQAMTYKIAREIIKYDGPYPYTTGLMIRVSRKIANVDVAHEPRRNGRSNYTFRKLVSLWMNGFTSFSVLPLRMSTYMGLILSLTGFLFLVVIVLKKIKNPEMLLGWTSIISAVLFFGGIQLISLGIIGEYVGRIYLTINKTPQYAVREKTNCENDGDLYELR